MRSINVIIPLACIVQARGKELTANFTHDIQDSMDNKFENLADNLVDKLFDHTRKALPLHHVELDSTSLRKPGHLALHRQAYFPPPKLHPAPGKSPSSQASYRPQYCWRASNLQTEKKAEKKDMYAEQGTASTVADLDQLASKATGFDKGLPFWWEAFWSLPFTRRGAPGEALTLGDTMHVFRTNIEQIFGGYPSYDGAPMADGDISGLTDGTMYLYLKNSYDKCGDVYKLCFGPKSFMVVSNPVMLKHILQDNTKAYDKGVLAEILEPIMGKGLIPADPETWKIRRRAIVPGFHAKWIERMVKLFGEETLKATKILDQAAATGKVVDVEERFGSLALDIIGKSIFNYDFDSTTNESPVVKAAISTLKETEHRAMTPLPYWNIPFATDIVPRQRLFKKNMALLNDRLNAAIDAALSDRKEEDTEALQNRDYSSIENPSMLRFMVDMKDEDSTSKQLRDDLMTMLVAGHETTASALTWAIFELVQNPALLSRVQAEVDEYLPNPDTLPTLETLRSMQLVRLCIAESLRMYPEPPLLIRRAVEEDTLPAGSGELEVKLLRGMDLFLSIYNLHRSPLYWDNPDTFDPDRWLKKKESTVKGWAGFDPAKWEGKWYPTETSADWAYLPFGGGPRKCVGDQFATLEATVALAQFVRRYEFEFAAPTATPDQVGTATGATIHTKNGMWMKLNKRKALVPAR